MEYKKHERHTPQCLECGDVIMYGRSDKRFCCEDCKTKYHNAMARKGRAYRTRIHTLIGRNYDILDSLVSEGRETADVAELVLLGFTPGVMTSCHRTGRHDVYGCYDIMYRMTGTKLYSIMKLKNL